MEKKVYTLSLDGKSTGAGSYENSIVISTKQRKILEPMHKRSSRTGNHWTDTYYLLPGRYIVVNFYRSGRGNSYHTVKLLTINQNLETSYETLASNENGCIQEVSEEYEWILDLDERIRDRFTIAPQE